MYTTGERVYIGPFSREKVGNMVEDYITNIKDLTENRWRKVMESCGAQGEQDCEAATNTSLMENKRRALYVPSSPIESAEDTV
jgi:hypothetical protein